jgi:hypothetical protein
MNILVLPTNEIIPEYIYFLDSKNNILMDGFFTKLIYTDEWFTMNGLYINLPIEMQGIDTKTYTNSGSKQTIFFFSISIFYIITSIRFIRTTYIIEIYPNR